MFGFRPKCMEQRKYRTRPLALLSTKACAAAELVDADLGSSERRGFKSFRPGPQVRTNLTGGMSAMRKMNIKEVSAEGVFRERKSPFQSPIWLPS